MRLAWIGGGELPTAAAKRFCEWSKGGCDKCTITLIPWASARSLDILHKEFEEMGDNVFDNINVHCHMAPSASDMFDPLKSTEMAEKTIDMLKSSSSVFFFGGDQNIIMQVFDKYPLIAAKILDLYCHGLPIGGTSAGAAFMSKTMITGEGDFEVIHHNKVEVRSGLGLVKHAVIDQHFIKNKRLNRLISVLLDGNDRYGIGIDEDMAISLVDDVYGYVFRGERPDAKVVLLERHTTNTFSMNILDHESEFRLLS